MLSCVLVSAAVIELTVRKAALKRGIKTWYRLAQILEGTTSVPHMNFQFLARSLWNGKGHGKGQPKLESVGRLAEAFDCELSELLVRVPNKRSKQNGAHE